MKRVVDVQDFHVKTNRQKRLSPRKNTWHYCESCDKNYLPSGGKCEVCGKVSGVRRMKKDT